MIFASGGVDVGVGRGLRTQTKLWEGLNLSSFFFFFFLKAAFPTDPGNCIYWILKIWPGLSVGYRWC